MIAIVDYGVGNLFSLKSSFSSLGLDAKVTGNAEIIRKADRIVLPGVGAFGDAAEKLKESGLWDVLKAEAAAGKPFLGICLGMQLLLEKSFEFGEHEGLGFIPGSVKPIADVIPEGLKIPQMGWNALRFKAYSPLFSNSAEGEYVYFVHSYYCDSPAENVAVVCEYGAELTASVVKDNVFGCQFHPEKSGKAGLKILETFSRL